MGRKLNRFFIRALTLATASLKQLAQECDHHPMTFLKLRSGEREPTPEIAQRLAQVLRRRSRKLAELADELERLAEAEMEQANRTPK